MKMTPMIDSRPNVGGGKFRAVFASSGSILVHSAILVTLLAASHLRVESLAGPRSDIKIIVVPPVPPAAPPPPPPSGGDSQTESSKKARTLPSESAEIVQPRELTDEAPIPDAGAAEQGHEEGSPAGEPGGIPGGVPGGIPGGVPGGILGGTPGGVPGSSILDGLPGKDQPIYLTGDLRAPERTTFVKPQYPEVARKARAEGKVILEIVVGRTGDVEGVKVLRSNPVFDLAAVEAVRMWKYQPALQSGRPVRVYLTVVVEFQLK